MRGRKRKTKTGNRTLCDREAQCPYFQFHTRMYIVCEGVIPDTKGEILFGSQEQKELHYRVFCCGRWTYCERARAIYHSKYQEE